jgi:thiol-disulfide isomerase/thioredoxin
LNGWYPAIEMETIVLGVSIGNMDTVALFFYAPWCKPCQMVKPYYEDTVRPIYLLNGISCQELNYDEARTKKIMKNLGIRTVPTLCLMELESSSPRTEAFENEDIVAKIRSKVCMDSKEILLFALEKVSSFCTDELF